MAVVQNRYSANGSNTIFTAEFEVFSESHILVFLNDDEEQLVDKTAYDLINNAVVFKEAPADGTIVNLKIGTTPDDLFSPAVYYATAAASAEAAAISEANAATSATDASTSATNAANSATSASTSEANAATSETNASNSATSASTSAASAASSATSASNSVTIATTKASEASASATAAATSASNASTSESNAFTYMNDASSSASSAATYATQSSTSATNAANSATDAATSASNASASATSAATSETNAASSASSAATSEANASSSASSAATSETNAASSASGAATSEANASLSASAADASATSASSSATSASSSATSASSSATSASSSATSASASASAASTSETNAANSATNASTSATSASESASTATTQAGIATTKASEASASATASATSEANAATSKANALASETNAATSEANAAVSEANAAISAAQASLLASSEFSSSGYTTKVKQEDRWLETDTPNVIVDKVGDDYVIDGVVYNQLGDELVTNGTFDSDFTVVQDDTSTIYTNGWCVNSQGTATADNGVMTFSGINTYPALKFTNSTNLGGAKAYIVKIDCVSITGTAKIEWYDGAGYHYTTLTTSNSSYIITTTNSTAITQIRLAVSNGGVLVFDNISVKELKQATLPLAPFATGSTDELLDDKVNGLTTQQAHSKGDIVVTGNQLVTNGTFDSDISGWTSINVTQSWDNGRLKLEDTSTSGLSYHTIATKIGKKYTITYKTEQGTATNFAFGVSTNSSSANVYWSGDLTSFGLHTFTFIATSPTTYIQAWQRSIGYTYFDNISVRLADTTYQAITDTTAGDLLSDTSKFQVIPDVTRHDIITLTPSGYKTYKGLNYYQDDTLDRDTIASDRGWSKLGNNTYVDEDGDKCFIVGVCPRFNAKMFHPYYNFFGSLKNSNSQYWYNETTARTSIYDTIGQSVSTTSGRPDSKLYSKPYNMGEGGLIQLGYNYAKDDIDLDIEANSLVSGDMGIQSGVECGELTFPSNATNTLGNTHYVDAIKPFSAEQKTLLVGQIVIGYTVAGGISGISKVTGFADNYTFYTEDIITRPGTDGTYYFSIVQQSQTHLTKGTALTTDLIGNPTNYPSFLKNTLASGKSVHINPLLVGQDGTSYIFEDTNTAISTYNIKASNKAIQWIQGVRGSGDIFSVAIYDFSFDTVNNEYNSFQWLEDTMFFSVISANSPTQSTPKQVVKVLPKVIASNSHSIYKGGLLTNAVTGKVSVGNGANGLESKSLENVNVGDYDIVVASKTNTTINIEPYKTVIYADSLSASTAYWDSGHYYISKIDDSGNPYTLAGLYSLKDGNYWIDYGTERPTLLTTPSHSTISLDNSDSPASKVFTALSVDDNNEYCLDVYGQELAYNSGTTSYDGDDDTFEQLTNGVLTDLNANTVQTKVLSKKLGVFKK